MTEETEQPEIELIPVKIIGSKGRSVLIQVQVEGPQRYYVPKSAVVDNKVPADVIAKGIEYGIAWETYLDLSEITIDALASKLRRNGIWTQEDLEQQDRRLAQMAYNVIGRAVRQAAKRADQRKPPRRT
jgi:hypothetical protein